MIHNASLIQEMAVMSRIRSMTLIGLPVFRHTFAHTPIAGVDFFSFHPNFIQLIKQLRKNVDIFDAVNLQHWFIRDVEAW